MKEFWIKFRHKELLPDFGMHGVLVFLGGGLLFCPIMFSAKRPVVTTVDLRMIGLAATAFFVIMLLCVISLYRIAASHIRWYQGVLDAIPAPIIITDQDGNWRQVNKATRSVINLEQKNALNKHNSKHLIDKDGSVLEKTFTHRGMTYRVTGSRLTCQGEESGYVLFLNTVKTTNLCETRDQLIAEINNLLTGLSTATDQFHDYAISFAGCTVRQAGIINDLTDMITGIATGNIKEADDLNKKMNAVKEDILHHMERSHANMENVKQTVRELNATRHSIGTVLHEIDGTL